MSTGTTLEPPECPPPPLPCQQYAPVAHATFVTNTDAAVADMPVTIKEIAKAPALPHGYTSLGYQSQSSSPNRQSGAKATIVLQIDSTLVQGQILADLVVFNYGTLVPDCTTPGALGPDPCVSSRDVIGGSEGDFAITVLTGGFGSPNFGRCCKMGPAFPQAPGEPRAGSTRRAVS